MSVFVRVLSTTALSDLNASAHAGLTSLLRQGSVPLENTILKKERMKKKHYNRRSVVLL